MLAFPLRRVTPENLRCTFQYHLSQNPGDQQMALCLQISREWKRLWYQRTVLQEDLDRLLEPFAQYLTPGIIGGSCIPPLWGYIAAWGRKLGLSVPDEFPWWPPLPPRPQPSGPIVRGVWLSAPWLNEES